MSEDEMRENGQTLSRCWLDDPRLQAVLRARRTAAFELDLKTGRQHHSPFIGELIAGRYDGRVLSQVMLEDGVIHPEDVSSSVQFRETAKLGRPGQIDLRLLTPDGTYHWFSMTLAPCPEAGEGVVVGMFVDEEEEARKKEHLRRQASHDPISGLYNKKAFFDETGRMLKESPDLERYLLRFDIDRFKLVNELYSVSEGDLLLRHVGDVVRALSRPGETYARMGSDIFCVSLCRTKDEVLDYLKTLEERVNEYPLPYRCFLSSGIVYLKDRADQPVSTLCDWAAMAQRSVKGNYLRSYAFYECSMSARLNREHYMVGLMHRALIEKQFYIELQPKIDLSTRRTVGAEALARWRHPQDGVIQPGEFIPLFERNGFIVRLDEYIWELACQTLREWMELGLKPVPVSVNVSRAHLHDPDFCAKVAALVRKYDLPPELLILEITESAFAEQPEAMYLVMDSLRSHGFTFSMDDFGSGYSSLSVLKDIPVDEVKIDLHFLQKARQGEQVGLGILKAAVRLVRDIGYMVVVEGVETREQADFLQSIGCTRAQGFYYARPMEVKRLTRHLLDGDRWEDYAANPTPASSDSAYSAC